MFTLTTALEIQPIFSSGKVTKVRAYRPCFLDTSIHSAHMHIFFPSPLQTFSHSPTVSRRVRVRTIVVFCQLPPHYPSFPLTMAILPFFLCTLASRTRYSLRYTQIVGTSSFRVIPTLSPIGQCTARSRNNRVNHRMLVNGLQHSRPWAPM